MTQSSNMPQRLGNYQLIREIGRGGFATVYLGKHIHLESQAAIKILHPRLTTAELVEQFRREARTIAELTHSHIVRVFDFDVEGDLAFLVMDFATFGSVRKQYAPGVFVPLEAVVVYVRQIASALSYAHQHRVIHRDVKPENMLIGQSHRILLSDFGLALLVESSGLQGVQQEEAAGTIAYIAPEQIQGRTRPASDQYALAICAYEWLCGRRPFEGTPSEVTMKHLSAEPPPLHLHNPAVSIAVEQVVLQALEKDPANRFPSVKEFALALKGAAGLGSRPEEEQYFSTLSLPLAKSDDPAPIVLGSDEGGRSDDRLLASVETIERRGGGALFASASQDREFNRPLLSRRKLVLTLTGLGTLAVGGGLAQALARSSPPVAQAPLGRTVPTQAQVTPSVVPSASATATPTMAPTAKPTAQKAKVGPPEHNGQQPPGKQPGAANLPQPMLLFTLANHYAVSAVAWSPNGKLLVSGGAGSLSCVWRAGDGTQLESYADYSVSRSSVVRGVAWSPDSGRVTSGSDDKTVLIFLALSADFPLQTLDGHSAAVNGVAWSPDGGRIASGSGDNTVRVWNANTVASASLLIYRGHNGPVNGVMWSPDGTRIASASADNTVQVWSANTVASTGLLTYRGHNGPVMGVAWSPGGKRIASASADNTVQVWDPLTGFLLGLLSGHSAAVNGVAWSPDGKWIASASSDRTVQVWDATTRVSMLTYRGHQGAVNGVAWSPDGKRIASASTDRTVQVWEV